MSHGTSPPVVDDGLLIRVLVAGDPMGVPALHADEVHTTGLWWYRLCRAVMGDASGSLSSGLAHFDPELRRAVVTDLPPGVTIVGLSTLGPLAADVSAMAQNEGVRLNALAAEAAAAAIAGDADLLVSTHSPSLADAASVCGFTYRHVTEPSA